MNRAETLPAGQNYAVRSSAGNRPKLLVSVRSVAEAVAAIDGGADIIDVKEPGRGSLGRANPDVIADVSNAVRTSGAALPISAAMGELTDYVTQLPVPRMAKELDFGKLGLAGAAGWPDWRVRWKTVRRRIERRRGFPMDWVGVVYADADTAGSPPAEQIIQEAAESGCAGVLVDTYRKGAGGLLDFVDEHQLTSWADVVHRSGSFYALAGRISIDDLSRLKGIPADIVAVRSGVCPAHRRDGEVSADLVAAFRQALQPRRVPVPS